MNNDVTEVGRAESPTSSIRKDESSLDATTNSSSCEESPSPESLNRDQHNDIDLKDIKLNDIKDTYAEASYDDLQYSASDIFTESQNGVVVDKIIDVEEEGVGDEEVMDPRIQEDEMLQQSNKFWEEFDLHSQIIDPTKSAVHNFFYTNEETKFQTTSETGIRQAKIPEEDENEESDENIIEVSKADYEKIRSFWRAYDDIIILSLTSQLGVLFRILSSSVLSRSDSNTFHEGSALFTTLPLNFISCVILGFLCDGPEAWSFIKRGEGEFRNVQIEGLERRIKASTDSLVLFMAKREEGDVLQHYRDHFASTNEKHISQNFRQQPEVIEDMQTNKIYTRGISHKSLMGENISLSEHEEDDNNDDFFSNMKSSPETVFHKRSSSISPRKRSPELIMHKSNSFSPTRRSQHMRIHSHAAEVSFAPENPDTFSFRSVSNLTSDDSNTELVEQNPPVENASDPIQTLISISNGWDVNNTQTAMSSDLMLGLRVGFCGALSSFASWNGEMVALLRAGQFGQAFMGYIIGICLPLLGYRLGVQLAIFLFVARCRRETRKDERRGGYGIRPPADDADEDFDEETENENEDPSHNPKKKKKKRDPRPSVRAFATALFVLALIVEFTSIVVFTSTEKITFALQLLFSPLGVMLRWKLNKFNVYFPNFPIGTFSANMLSCALSGSIGFLLAGNPGPEERIVLQSLISGLGGTLSTLSLFIHQILAGLDAIVLKWDGMIYAIVTIAWGMIIGLVTEQSKNWADSL